MRTASGKSFGEVVEWAYTILDSIDHADPVWGAAAARFDHMIEVSRYYTVERGGTSTSLNRLGLIMVPVTEDAESVDEAKAAIDDLLDNPAVRDVLSLDGSDGFRLLIDGGFQLSSYDAVGDINGDGFMDLALRLSTNHYFLLGQAGGFQGVLPLSAAIAAGQMLRTEVIAPDDEDFSTGLTRIDDVNGDGIDDWLIGTYILGGEEVLVESNVTYIVFGSGQVPATIDLTSLDDSSGYRIDGPVILGRSENYDGTSSISYAGDINGDGIGDFFFNALADDDALDRSVFVVFGQANGAPATLDGRLLDGSNGFRIDQTLPDTTGFGNVVPGRSDVNGDGLDDLLIAASDAGLGGEGLSGSVYVVFGRAGGFPAVLDVTTLDGSNGFRMDGRGNEQAGSSVSSADFNGDGIDDILIGTTAPVDEEEGFSSDAYVVFGKPGGFDVTFALGDLDGSNGFRIIDSASESVQLSQISRAGDFNGDGIEDLVVADGSSGNVYVIYGRNGGFAPILDLATFDEVLQKFVLPGISTRMDLRISPSIMQALLSMSSSAAPIRPHNWSVSTLQQIWEAEHAAAFTNGVTNRQTACTLCPLLIAFIFSN